MSVALVLQTPWSLLGLVAFPLAWKANAPVRARAHGLALIPALRDTGLAMLVWSVATAVGLILG